MKKYFVLLLLSFVLVSCGKEENQPVTNTESQKVTEQKVFKNNENAVVENNSISNTWEIIETWNENILNQITSDCMGINPTVRDKIDYGSLQFTFTASEDTRQKLLNVNSIDFYNSSGTFLWAIQKDNFTIDVEVGCPGDNLIWKLPLSVGEYLKGKKDAFIKYELNNGKNKIFSDWMKKSDPYEFRLEKILPAPEFGISTKIALNTMLVPGKCDLYNEKNEKILKMLPENFSNQSVFIKDIPKNTISVYTICNLSDSSTIKTEAISLN